MKVVLLLALVAGIFASDIADIINKSGAKWEAGTTRFSEMSVEEFKSLLNPRLARHASDHKAIDLDVIMPAEAPTNFDARTKWPQCKTIGTIRNQAQCGSCWAFAGSEVLSDRFCIAGQDHGMLSPQDLVSCDYLDDGCNGGNLESEMSWMKSKGITTDQCMSYKSAAGAVPKCPNKCDDGSAIKRFKPKSYAHVPASGIINELVNNGPCEVAFDVYDDFRSYKSGVYHHVTGEMLGGHAVKVIGYGVEGSTPYWLVANSWDYSWGMQGTFKILRGSDECGIEDEVYCPYI